MSETAILQKIRLKASKLGYRLFRNQVGQYKLADGRFLRSGLCVGSSDLIGWKTVRITQDMVGMDIAQFVAMEVKTPTGKLKPEQENFLKVVRESGGIAIVARSADDLTNT